MSRGDAQHTELSGGGGGEESKHGDSTRMKTREGREKTEGRGGNLREEKVVIMREKKKGVTCEGRGR